MEVLILVGALGLFLVWRIISAGQAMARPIPEEIPPENRVPFRVTWIWICVVVILFSFVFLVLTIDAGIALTYEQQGLCDNSIRYPNPPFGDVGQCTLMVLPDKR